MAKPRIPKEGDIFYIPNFYDNVLMWYRVLGVQRFAGDKTRAMVFFEYIGEEKYRHSSAVIKSLDYDIGGRKFYVNIKAVPRRKVDNEEPPNLIDIRRYIPAFDEQADEQADAQAFLEENQEEEYNLEYRQKLLDMRDLLYEQLRISGDTRLFWKYIDDSRMYDTLRSEIMYLLNEAARLVLYIPEEVIPMLGDGEAFRIKSKQIAGLNAIYNKGIDILPINMVVIANSLTPEWMSKTEPDFTGDNTDCRSMVLPPKEYEWKLLYPDCMDEKFPEDIAPYMYKLVLTKPHGLSQTYYRCFASDTFPDMRQMFCFVERSGGGGWQ